MRFLKKQGDICSIGDTADAVRRWRMVGSAQHSPCWCHTAPANGTGILRRPGGKSETRCIVVTEFRTAEAAQTSDALAAYAFLPAYVDDTSVLETSRGRPALYPPQKAAGR